MDLQKVINNLKQLADYCDRVTSGNVSHKIAHLKYAIINIAESLESNNHKDRGMTLDEAIQHAQDVANNGCDQCAKDHQQLADWLKELKELRELGWHPASEPPVFDEFDDNKEVIGIWMQENSSAYFVTIPYNVADYVQYENGKWLYDGSSVPVKYWCYPPKKDE